MLNNYALPRVLYGADHSDCRPTPLRDIDRRVRVSVRKWFHLHQSVCEGLLYSRTLDGGLGLTKLSAVIANTQARRMFRLGMANDRLVRCAARVVAGPKGMERYWQRAGGDVGRLPVWIDPPRGASDRDETPPPLV